MTPDQRCGAISGRFCSGETPVDECYECMEFVNTCDECFSPGSNQAWGWNEGSGGITLCNACYGDENRKAAP